VSVVELSPTTNEIPKCNFLKDPTRLKMLSPIRDPTGLKMLSPIRDPTGLKMLSPYFLTLFRSYPLLSPTHTCESCKLFPKSYNDPLIEAVDICTITLKNQKTESLPVFQTAKFKINKGVRQGCQK
jgi:hypothetical protein